MGEENVADEEGEEEEKEDDEEDENDMIPQWPTLPPSNVNGSFPINGNSSKSEQQDVYLDGNNGTMSGNLTASLIGEPVVKATIPPPPPPPPPPPAATLEDPDADMIAKASAKMALKTVTAPSGAIN